MSSDPLHTITSANQKAGLLIDSNLLLLRFVGQVDPRRIAKFKRTSVFTIDDYLILENIISHFDILITTPNILTEVSNLANQLHSHWKTLFAEVFKEQVHLLTEHYLRSQTACNQDHFSRLGLTDSVILELARKQSLVLTVDFTLYTHLLSSGFDTINFNHLIV